MIDLSDAAAIRSVDTQKMIDLTLDYPRQFREGDRGSGGSGPHPRPHRRGGGCGGRAG